MEWVLIIEESCGGHKEEYFAEGNSNGDLRRAILDGKLHAEGETTFEES